MTTDGGAQAGEAVPTGQRIEAFRAAYNDGVYLRAAVRPARVHGALGLLLAACDERTRERDALAAQVAALTAERDAADELRQQLHRAKSIVMDSQQREVVALREQVEALTAAASEARNEMIRLGTEAHKDALVLTFDRQEAVAYLRTLHQRLYPHVRALGDALYAATTPPAGAQEIAPEASEPMEQCEWCGRQYPRSEMNTMPWPDDEHTRRICDRCVDEPN